MQEIIRSSFINLNVHQKLRFLRKRNRQTQEILGDMVVLSSRTIRAFETGERLPDLPTISMLIDALCLDNYEAQQLLYSWEKANAAQNQFYPESIGITQ